MVLQHSVNFLMDHAELSWNYRPHLIVLTWWDNLWTNMRFNEMVGHFYVRFLNNTAEVSWNYSPHEDHRAPVCILLAFVAVPLAIWQLTVNYCFHTIGFTSWKSDLCECSTNKFHFLRKNVIIKIL